MKKKGFTLIELLVVIAIIAMLLAILMPALNKVKKIAQRVVCGTNLKGLGNGMTVYSSDNDGQFACQGQNKNLIWAHQTDNWWVPNLVFGGTGTNATSNLTIGASLYLLVRLADVSPKSFVCPSSDQKEMIGKNPLNTDFVDCFDFGWVSSNNEGPANCVSYSYHQPYMADAANTGKAGRFRADDTRTAAFAVMADKNPWYDPKLSTTVSAATWSESVGMIGDHWNNYLWITSQRPGLTDRQQVQVANAQPHEREGQNVMFADGHNNFEKTSDVGAKNDNIYTPQMSPLNANDPKTWRIGNYNAVNNPSRVAAERPMYLDDSFLVNDYAKPVPQPLR